MRASQTQGTTTQGPGFGALRVGLQWRPCGLSICPTPVLSWGQTVEGELSELRDRLGLRVITVTAEPFLLVNEIIQHRGHVANCAIQFRQDPLLVR